MAYALLYCQAAGPTDCGDVLGLAIRCQPANCPPSREAIVLLCVPWGTIPLTITGRTSHSFQWVVVDVRKKGGKKLILVFDKDDMDVFVITGSEGKA